MRLKAFVKYLSKIDVKEAIKSLFEEDFGEKDVQLIVNGLAKRLTPELQSILILSLVNYRDKEIQETQEYLNKLVIDRDKLISTIVQITKK